MSSFLLGKYVLATELDVPGMTNAVVLRISFQCAPAKTTSTFAGMNEELALASKDFLHRSSPRRCRVCFAHCIPQLNQRAFTHTHTAGLLPHGTRTLALSAPSPPPHRAVLPVGQRHVDNSAPSLLALPICMYVKSLLYRPAGSFMLISKVPN
jgi:hypothetical protein